MTVLRSETRMLIVPFRLVAAPAQYDGKPAVPQRAPAFNDHGDEILTALAFD